MKYSWIYLAIAILLLVGLCLLRQTQTQSQIEGFGVFGCSPIAYDKAISDMYTASELQIFLADSWTTQTPDERNKTLADWDGMPCQQQNDIYTQGIAEKAKRAAVEKLVSAQPQNSVATT